MPVKKINYTASVFYKIVCRDITIIELYVGHTTNFRLRKSQHKSACNKEQSIKHNLRVYKFIRDNGGWENWDMIVIAKQSCVDELEARAIERNHIETLCATLNSNIPGRTISEYRELHKDKTFEANKKYYAENKEAILASQAEYYQLNREKIIETVKTYAENNKDKIVDYQKEHYQRNKDKLQEKARLYRAANLEKIREYQRKTRENKKTT
jgi:hypothetical protein